MAAIGAVIAAVPPGKHKFARPTDDIIGSPRSRPDQEPARAGSGYAIRNRVLSRMGAAEFDLLRPQLELATFERGQAIQHADAPIQHVYFIEKGLISLLARSTTDLPVEIATIDSTGMVGIEVMVDAARAIHRALVLTPSTSALRIEIDAFHAAIERQPLLRLHFAHVSQDLMRRSAQNLLCNTRHELEPRLAKWLALAGEPFADGILPVTHETIALALGVRRPSITAALASLEGEGLVVKQRGALRLPDLPALRARACSCLPVMMRTFDTRTTRSGDPHRLPTAF